MAYLVLFLFACCGVFLWLARIAPEGFEDADGFHYGPEPDAFDGRRRADAPAPAPVAPFHEASNA